MKMHTFEVIDKKTGKKKTCVALVRKLTEKECGRLMGVSDTDIQIIQESGVSRSSQYKMYGNSIVVDTLYHLLRKLLVQPANESQQMSIFDVL